MSSEGDGEYGPDTYEDGRSELKKYFFAHLNKPRLLGMYDNDENRTDKRVRILEDQKMKYLKYKKYLDAIFNANDITFDNSNPYEFARMNAREFQILMSLYRDDDESLDDILLKIKDMDDTVYDDTTDTFVELSWMSDENRTYFKNTDDTLANLKSKMISVNRMKARLESPLYGDTTDILNIISITSIRLYTECIVDLMKTDSDTDDALLVYREYIANHLIENHNTFNVLIYEFVRIIFSLSDASISCFDIYNSHILMSEEERNLHVLKLYREHDDKMEALLDICNSNYVRDNAYIRCVDYIKSLVKNKCSTKFTSIKLSFDRSDLHSLWFKIVEEGDDTYSFVNDFTDAKFVDDINKIGDMIKITMNNKDDELSIVMSGLVYGGVTMMHTNMKNIRMTERLNSIEHILSNTTGIRVEDDMSEKDTILISLLNELDFVNGICRLMILVEMNIVTNERFDMLVRQYAISRYDVSDPILLLMMIDLNSG